MAYNSFGDAELWNLILKDDYRAFTALFERYWPKLYKTSLHYIHDPEAAEEVVHDLFLNIWNRKAYLEIHDFNKYFKAAARYQVYAYIKKNRSVAVTYTDLQEQNQSEQCLFNTADEKITYRELEDQLNEHLKQLPERCQEIFILSRMDHLSNNEIAERLGISKRTVENQITRALQYIRYHFKDIALCILLFWRW